MTLLSTLVEPLKREIAVPGDFASTYPVTSDPDLIGSLADGFAEAQLWGFFGAITLTQQGSGDTIDFQTDPDLSGAGGALILTFTATRIVRAQLRVLNSMEKYKAGPVEYEIQKAASVLKAELDYLTDRLNQLIEEGRKASGASARLAVVMDNYVARSSLQFAGGYYAYELGGGW